MERFENDRFASGRAAVAALVLAVPRALLARPAGAAGLTKTPPGKFKKVSTLVKLPDFDAPGGVAKGLKIDHTPIEFNPGHPGVEEPHDHVAQWLLSPAAVKKEMQ